MRQAVRGVVEIERNLTVGIGAARPPSGSVVGMASTITAPDRVNLAARQRAGKLRRAFSGKLGGHASLTVVAHLLSARPVAGISQGTTRRIEDVAGRDIVKAFGAGVTTYRDARGNRLGSALDEHAICDAIRRAGGRDYATRNSPVGSAAGMGKAERPAPIRLVDVQRGAGRAGHDFHDVGRVTLVPPQPLARTGTRRRVGIHGI